MWRWTWLWATWICAGAILAAGCGKPTLPGQQFQGQRMTLPGAIATDTPLPAKPIQEFGTKDAKVRVVVFFPIDDPHKKIMDLVEELTAKYPGKVYIKYFDYRTPEGGQAFQRAKATVACIMIDGQSSIELPSQYGPRTVDFVKEMGRHWTPDDLRAAIAHAVTKAYGKQK